MRKTLSSTHIGPESLEDAVVDYIVRNLDLYDVQTSVNVRLTTLFVIKYSNPDIPNKHRHKVFFLAYRFHTSEMTFLFFF